MAIFQAFRALRPVPDKAEAVAALPYDVVTREEAKEIGDQNPDSFLHVAQCRDENFRQIRIFTIRKSMTVHVKTSAIWRRMEFWFRTEHRVITSMS